MGNLLLAGGVKNPAISCLLQMCIECLCVLISFILLHVIPNMIDSLIILAIIHAEPGYDTNPQTTIYGGLITEGFLCIADILVWNIHKLFIRISMYMNQLQ